MTASIEKYKLADGTIHYRVRQYAGSKKNSVTVGASEKTAEDKKTLVEADKIKGKIGMPDTRKKVYEHIADYLQYSILTKSKGTYQLELHALRPFGEALGQMELVRLTKAHLDGFMLGLLRTNKVNGVKIIMRVVHACLERAGLERNPCDGVDNLQEAEVARVIPEDELKKLFSVIRSPQLLEILLILRNTGMRIGEALALDTSLHFFGSHIRIERHQMKNRRGSSPRPKIIPITKEISFLYGYVKRKSGKIFKTWNRSRVGESLRWYKKKAGIRQRLRPHDLKHTFCSNFKGDLASLSEITGNTWKTLQRYVHSDESKLRAAMNGSQVSWDGNGTNRVKNGNKLLRSARYDKLKIPTISDGK